MLILKQNAANTVPTPPAGKGTIFLDDSDTLSVKTSDGNVETFPTVAASNSQVVFMNGTSLSGEAAFTYNFNTNVLSVSGNVAAGNILTDNLLYANGSAWDLQQPGGSNTEIQFNDADSFGGSAALTFNKTTNAVSMGGALTVTGNASAGNLSTGGMLTVTGNANAANFGTGGLIVANGNITGGNLITSGSANVGELNASGNAVITGNLTVNGNVVYVNVETLDVEDPIIVLGGGPNGAAPVSDDGKDRGTQLQYFSSTAKNAFMGWDNSNAEFGMGSVVTVTNEVVTFTTYGNLRVGNIIGNGQALTGLTGANVTGTVANATHASTSNTVVDAAQPNITSVGTLSSLAVTGNTTSNNFNATTYITASGVYANSGSVGAQYITASIDVTANANVTAGNVYANSGTVGAVTGNFSGNVSAAGIKTNNLYYANGSPWDLQLPGGSNTEIQFNDGDQFGGSAAFTFNKTSNLVTVAANLNANNLNATTHVTAGNVYANSGTVGASLLTGTLTTASQPNVTSLGTLSSLSVTGNAGANNFNATTHVTAGNVYANSGTIGASLLTGTLTTAAQPNVTSVGTLANLAVTGNITSGNLYSNSGTVGASLLTGTLTTASQPNVTSLGTLSGLGVNGNITAANITANTGVFTGNAAGLTNIPSGNLSGQVANALVAGTVYTNAQPNITSLGTLSVLSVDGANITLANGTYVGNGAGLSALAGGNVTGQVANALVAGTVYTAAQPNITSVGTLSSLSVTGNVTGANFLGNLANGNSSVAIPAAAGNVNVSVNGTANVLVVTATGANVAGTLNSSGNANVGNLGTGGLIVATGNVTGGNLVTSGALSVTGNANVGNIGGNNAVFTLVTGTLTTAAQPNVTSVGTLTSLGVTGNVTAGNVYANTGTVGASLLTGTLTTAAQPNVTSVGSLTSLTVTGNASAGNISTGGVLSVTGNANVGNIGAAAGVFTTVAGSLTTASQPNVTSVGTLTSLAVTGNATAGNVYANSGTVGASLLTGTLTTAAQPNVTSVGSLTSLTVTGNVAAGNLTTTGVLSVTGTGVSSIGGNLDMTSNTIINLATPTNASDAATKQYVDDVAQGLNIHDACAAATPDTLANITSGTITYNNGTSGVGATLVTTGTFNLIDGVNVQTSGTRILVKNEANAVFNGIYTYTNTTAITRALDYDSVPEVEAGDFTFVTGGTLYDNTGWVQTDSPAAIGTAGNNISFTQFSGAGTYNAGTGLTLTGSTFSVNASQTQITSVGTLTGLNVNGTVTASAFTANTGIFTGNGAGLSQLTGANVTGTVSAATTAGTVTTAAQPNITSVGTLTSLAVTGNANVGNLNATTAVVASTLTSNVATGTAPLTVTSTTRVANLNVAYANVADLINVSDVTTGTYYPVLANAATGNVSEGSNSALTFAAATGTLSATVFSGSGASLTTLNASNISSGTLAQARLANSTITFGNTTLTLGATTTTVAGLTNITSTQFTSNVATGTAPFVVTSTTQVANLNVATSGSATTAGTVTTAAQPNITSVGTLTSLAVSGNITAPSYIANTGYLVGSVNAAVSAAGTAQGNATVIASMINVVSTVASGAGVALPTATAGMRITLVNTAANALLVYPASGGQINSLGANISFSQPAGGRLDFVATSTTQWYTLNATYA